jgi:hypothetical protein
VHDAAGKLGRVDDDDASGLAALLKNGEPVAARRRCRCRSILVAEGTRQPGAGDPMAAKSVAAGLYVTASAFPPLVGTVEENLLGCLQADGLWWSVSGPTELRDTGLHSA